MKKEQPFQQDNDISFEKQQYYHQQDEKDQQINHTTIKKMKFCWKHKRNKCLIIFSVSLIIVIIIILVPIMIIQQQRNISFNNNYNNDNNDNNNIVMDDSFDDSTQANAYVPPLNQPFPYNQIPIKGINIGGWFVLEPFITPSIFEQVGSAKNEWELCERLETEENKKKVLEQHYATFITEKDFQLIQQMGFNHVRIPIGHWAIRPQPNEPFLPKVAWTYLLRGLQWARKYGLRVMLELHTAPGSQNGYNHSGGNKRGEIQWLNDHPHGEKNANETLLILKDIIEFFYNDNNNDNQDQQDQKQKQKQLWSHVIPIFGVLNEPAMMMMRHEPVQHWYEQSYQVIRQWNPQVPILSYHDGFLGLPTWTGFFKNWQQVFLELDKEKQASIPCQEWKPQIEKSNQFTAPTLVGEFSFATNDCGKYLNGMGLGTRYEGTLEDDDKKHPHHSPPLLRKNITCEQIEDWSQWSLTYQHFLNTFIQRQMDAYEAGVGWFFWTYKTENHINPHWDYLLAWEKGWAPKDVNVLDFHCPQ